MEGKKSFKLYTDMIELVNGSNVHGVEIEPMTDEEAGLLFRWILEYVNDLHPQVPKCIKYAVAQIKKILDMDLERYQNQCDVNQKNGALGGRPKKPKETENNRMGFEETERNPKKPDKDKDKDKDINVSKETNNICSKKCSIEELFGAFWSSYPNKIGKQKCLNWFKTHKPNEALVQKMIDTIGKFKKSKKWSDPQYIPYPYTWLNRGGWEDELEPEKESTFQSAPKNPIQWEEAKGSTFEEDLKFCKEHPEQAKKILDGMDIYHPERSKKIREMLGM